MKGKKSWFWCAAVLYKVLKDCSLLCEIPLHASINSQLFFHTLQVVVFTFTKVLLLVVCQVFLCEVYSAV